ncbi:MAG: hypothetical protein ABI393_11510 [Paralcaligenes sp.]
MIHSDGSRGVHLPDGSWISLDAVRAYDFTPRHPREAGTRASITEELIQPAYRHPMAVFFNVPRPDAPPSDFSEDQVRALLKAAQSRMEIQDPSRPWPDLSGLPEFDVRKLLVRVIDLENRSQVRDAPTWSTALAARAARQALEKRRKGPSLPLDGPGQG